MTSTHDILIELLGEDAPKDSVSIEKIGEIIMRGVIVEAMSRMDEKTLDAFDALLDENKDPETLAQFMKEHVPGIEGIVRAEANRLIAHYKELATAA